MAFCLHQVSSNEKSKEYFYVRREGRKITYVTFEKWKCKFDRDCEMVTWLDCESCVEAGSNVVRKLKCVVCAKFRSNILHKRNFNDNWISGANSVCISNICEHASSEQHIHAMALLAKEHASATSQSLVANALIAVALNKISAEEKTWLRHKFGIVYFFGNGLVWVHYQRLRLEISIYLL